MKRTLLPVLGFLVPFLGTAQECANGRYIAADHFPTTTVTNAVVYGSNTAVAGGTQTLRMDVYEPAGDPMEDRPVILVAFGGSFISGTRADVASICIDFAKRGYVAIAPDYRVGFFFPNAATTTRAVMRGAHDMKACVRYLRKSVAELNNPYRIDPDRIITGGVSAGAISALHAVYLDEASEIPAILAGESAALGGVEGNSGSPGYSSDVFACYSFSGAIDDTLFIVPGDVPLASIHEVGDGVVPYYTQEVSVIGIPTGLTASGSHDIHIRVDNLGIVNCFKSYPGSGHVGYLTSDPVNALNWTAEFIGQLVCGAEVTCGVLPTGVTESASTDEFIVVPNPTNGAVRFELKEQAYIRVLDISGREVMGQRAVPGTVRLDLSALPDGVYMLHSRGTTEHWVRVVKAD